MIILGDLLVSFAVCQLRQSSNFFRGAQSMESLTTLLLGVVFVLWHASMKILLLEQGGKFDHIFRPSAFSC